MSEKIKVGNAEVEKANYDYFLSQYSKMPKEYVIADLVSKCEDYGRLYNAYEKLEVKKIQKENIIKEVREDLDKQIEFCTNEANGTTNDKYCRIAINYLKHLKDKLDKGE